MARALPRRTKSINSIQLNIVHIKTLNKKAGEKNYEQRTSTKGYRHI
jgi:hypothetical protein